LRELREKLGKNPEVLKTPVTKAKGLRIISYPCKRVEHQKRSKLEENILLRKLKNL